MTEPTKKKPEKAICAILVGKAHNPKKADQQVRAAQSCPYVALYTARGSTVIGVFTLPGRSKQWIEYPREQPFILGLEQVVTIITDRITALSPWSQGLVKPEDLQTPCGKSCPDCPQYRNGCTGCPATIFYYASE